MSPTDGRADETSEIEPLARHDLVDAGLTSALLAVLVWEASIHPRGPAVLGILHSLLFVGFASLALYRWFGPPRQRRPWEVALEVAMLLLAFPPFLEAAGPYGMFRVLRLPIAGARSVRALRRVLVTRGVIVLVAGAAISAVIGALAVLEFERDHKIRTFPDALWWAATTMTTVGYGDLSPNTLGGRVVAVVLMVLGIAAFGMTTALLARWFMDLSGVAEENEELRALRHELAALRSGLEPNRPGAP